MMYRICPRCGAALDPGEHCDCEEYAWPSKKEKEDKTAPEAADHYDQQPLPVV